MRAALYARVSTLDKGQNPEVQLGDLRDYAVRRGFEIVAEFVDFASGIKNGRPEYQRMFDAARKRRFDVLLVWRYDRPARPDPAPLRVDGFAATVAHGTVSCTNPSSMPSTWARSTALIALSGSMVVLSFYHTLHKGSARKGAQVHKGSKEPPCACAVCGPPA